MFATEDSAQMYADRLAELAATLGFDGWLVILLMVSSNFSDMRSEKVHTQERVKCSYLVTKFIGHNIFI